MACFTKSDTITFTSKKYILEEYKSKACEGKKQCEKNVKRAPENRVDSFHISCFCIRGEHATQMRQYCIYTK